MSEQFKYQQALELIAQDCDREAQTYLAVGMLTSGAVYTHIAKRLRKAAKEPMVTNPKPIFSHMQRDSY